MSMSAPTALMLLAVLAGVVIMAQRRNRAAGPGPSTGGVEPDPTRRLLRSIVVVPSVAVVGGALGWACGLPFACLTYGASTGLGMIVGIAAGAVAGAVVALDLRARRLGSGALVGALVGVLATLATFARGVVSAGLGHVRLGDEVIPFLLAGCAIEAATGAFAGWLAERIARDTLATRPNPATPPG